MDLPCVAGAVHDDLDNRDEAYGGRREPQRLRDVACHNRAHLTIVLEEDDHARMLQLGHAAIVGEQRVMRELRVKGIELPQRRAIGLGIEREPRHNPPVPALLGSVRLLCGCSKPPPQDYA